MASIVNKRWQDGARAYLVRYRLADGQQHSKQFKRKRDAEAFANVVEVDRSNGTLVNLRLGRITVDEWWNQWWPTVTSLRPSTRARDAQNYKVHIRPHFGDVSLAKLDRTTARRWVAELGKPTRGNLAPAIGQVEPTNRNAQPISTTLAPQAPHRLAQPERSSL